MAMTQVCKDCSDRYPACWGSCPKYLEAKAKHEEAKQAKIKEWKRNGALNHVQYYGLNQSKKRSERKG